MMRRLILLACLGTGCLSAQLQLFILQPGQADPIVNVPASFSFGECPVGDVRDVQFRLLNAGTGSTQLTTLAVTPPFSIPYEPSLPETVPPGGTVDFTVSFAPTGAGSFSATLTADGVSQLLTGTGTAVDTVAISVGDRTNAPVPLGAGAGIDFGSLAQGSTTSRQVVLTNPTQAAFTVQNIRVDNLQGSSFQMQPFALPISLAPGGSATLEVDFTPSSTGPQQGALEIDQLYIPLTGVGVNPLFPQPIILIAISSTASSEQGTLTVSLPSASQESGTGQVQMAVTPSMPGVNPDSGMVFLLSGTESVPFTVNQGDTAGQFGSAGSVAFQTGTTAGTIVFTVTLGDFTGTSSLTIPAAPANIDTTTAQYTSGGLDLEITGFDNTRTASTMTFTFRDANGATLNGGPITVAATTDFQEFFATSDDGGMFALHAFFPVTAGNPAQVDSVEIQITNSAGTTPTSKVYFTAP